MPRKLRHGDSVTFRGSYYFASAVANSSGVSLNNLNPALFGPNLNSIADAFLEYRFRRLVFRAVNLRTANDCFLAVSVPLLVRSPLSVTEVSEMERAFFFPGNNTVKLEAVFPSSHLLQDQLIWYRNQPSTPDDNFEYQGTVVIGGLAPASGQALMQVEYEIELRSKAPLFATVSRHRELQWADATDDDEKESAPPVDWEATAVRIVPGPPSEGSVSGLPPSRRPLMARKK
jgi:hypothetical protein